MAGGMMGSGSRRKLPDFCYEEFIPLDKVSAEFFACHVKCFEENRECSERAKTWDDLERCDAEYDDCFIKCCEKYA